MVYKHEFWENTKTVTVSVWEIKNNLITFGAVGSCYIIINFWQAMKRLARTMGNSTNIWRVAWRWQLFNPLINLAWKYYY